MNNYGKNKNILIFYRNKQKNRRNLFNKICLIINHLKMKNLMKNDDYIINFYETKVNICIRFNFI